MEGEAISATVGVLVQSLINVTKDEISLMSGLEENAEKLKGTLVKIQTSLDDAQKKFITDDAVKKLLKELEDVAFDADNVLDELEYKTLSKKMKSIRTENKKAASCCPSFNRYLQRRQMAVTIMKINTSFETIDKRATDLRLERSIADAPAAAASETDFVSLDPIFIGRDDDVSEIVGILTTATEQALSILPIVGMGGLGKTSLVRNVFNHQKTKAHFKLHIWVHVSKDFDFGVDAVPLLKKILKNLQGGNIEDESREIVVKKLREALGSKRYLLVLDEVWNQERHKCDDFIKSWSGITSTNGNCILVTTRNTEVGSIVNTLGIHHLKGLLEEECWSIIKGRAFKGGDIQPGFEDIGKSIAGRCQGLPLAANVVGEVLRDKSKDEWLSIKENWLSDVEGDEDNISRILRLSYDHLSSPSVKKCFAYCCVFPKGTHIEREELVELWMAEGFLQPSPTRDVENVGNKIVDLLVQSSLLQIVDKEFYNNIDHCVMHDLVHDVATSVLGSPKLNDSSSDGTYHARYISWHSGIPKEQTKWLRTLFYRGDISDINFSDFKSLHVLNLGGSFEELSDSIRELIHLRFLNISETLIGHLPDSIGELYHLQTFKASSSLIKLPSTFKFLINMRHLHLEWETELPPHVGMLTSLQSLRYFKVQNEDGHRIEELGSLENLKGTLAIYFLENVEGEDESKKACLLQKPGIDCLALEWDESRESETNDGSVLRGLQPHQNLKRLGIRGCKVASFPSWTEGLTNLMEIMLQSCTECEEIPSMGHLPCLKFVQLIDLKKVKSISRSFYGIDKCSSNYVFPALVTLELTEMPNLMEWVQVEIPCGAAVFPCLEYLKIKECNKLRSAPGIFPCLKKLEIDSVDSGIPLANICGINLTSLVVLQISRVGEMVSLPHWLFHNNQNLLQLEIKNCHKLRELPDGLQTLNSLKELLIEFCDNLELFVIDYMHKLHSLINLSIICIPKFTISSPMDLQPEDSLRTLEVLCLGADKSWDCVSFNKTVDEILRLGSLSLQILELRGKEDWESLPDHITHLTALSMLNLSNFGIQELPQGVGNLPLQKLELSNFKKMKHQPCVEVMQRLTNLTELVIEDCPLLEEGGIEQQIHHVPNLRFNDRQLR